MHVVAQNEHTTIRVNAAMPLSSLWNMRVTNFLSTGMKIIQWFIFFDVFWLERGCCVSTFCWQLG